MSDVTKNATGRTSYTYTTTEGSISTTPNTWGYTISLRVYTSGTKINYVINVHTDSGATPSDVRDGDCEHKLEIRDKNGNQTVQSKMEDCYSGKHGYPADKTITGSIDAKQTSGKLSVYLRPGSPYYYAGNPYGDDGSTPLIECDYSGAVPYVAPTCGIALQSESIYAGGAVSLRCTCSGTVTSGTVRRYYRSPSSSTWSSVAVKSNVTQSQTVSDTIPSDHGGYLVYWRYEVNNGENYATTAQKTVVSNSPPSTPPALNVPDTIAGGSSVEISWSASTDPDNNLVGYILERSIDGGTTWTLVYKGTALTATDRITAGTLTVRYRVKAYDSYDAESGYKQKPESGDIVINNNAAPTTPAAPITITPASLTVGISAVISWGASSDPDGDSFVYSLERSVNNTTSYTEIYNGTARNFTDTIGNWETVTYRVRAIDVHNAKSGYLTASTRTVTSNAAPTISCEYPDGADLGTKSAVFSITYSVNDANASDTLTVREIVDGVTKKTFTATRGTNYTFNFRTGSAASTDYWNTILNGEHTITLYVTDGKASATRTFHFLKSVGACLITLKNPISARTGMKIGTAVVSICGEFPEGAITAVQVSSNASDASPTWESCLVASGDTGYSVHGIGDRKKVSNAGLSETLLGGHVLFIHKMVNAGASFNYRIQCQKVGDEGGFISSVQGVFTEESL